MRTLKISIFPHLRATEPEEWEVTWEDFKYFVGQHDLARNKDGVPLYVPATFDPPRRSSDNVTEVHLLCLDLDDMPDPDVDWVLYWRERQGYAASFHTSHSHGPGFRANTMWRARLIFPLARPVTRDEWPEFWRRVYGQIGGRADPKCKNADRMFYVPSCPPEDKDVAIVAHFDGRWLDPDEVLSSSVATTDLVIADTTETVDRKDLKEHASKLIKSGAHAKWGRILRKVVDGEPFAEPGERDNTINTICRFYLIPYFPDAHVEQLAELFRPSIEKMMAIDHDCPTLDVVKTKLERSRREYFRQKAQQEQEERQAQNMAVAYAFSRRGIERDEPYTIDELKELAKKQKLTLDELLHQLVVQKGSTYYVWLHDRYEGPYMDAEAGSAIEALLAPVAANPKTGVVLRQMTREGLKPVSLRELIAEYGRVADEVVADLRATKTTFNRVTATITEAPCPMRPLVPQYSEAVDKWLQAMCGGLYEKMCDWLAVVTQLDRPCAAPYFEGPKATGKSLFAAGVSRIWTTRGPTSLEGAIDRFNDSIAGCPLIFADEFIPKTFQGDARTGEIRRLIQERERRYSRKNIPDAKLLGACRLVIAANNRFLLETTEELTENDIAAIMERIIHVPVRPGAAEYLSTLGEERVRRFVEDDEIARHALWLRDNRTVVSQGRFLVAGENSLLHRSMATHSGLRAGVAHWLVSYLLQPSRFDATSNPLIRRQNGKLLVNAKALLDNWTLYTTHFRTPMQSKLSRALSGLSIGRVHLRNPPAYFRVVNTDLLMTYAEENDLCTAHELLAALQRPQFRPIAGDGQKVPESTHSPDLQVVYPTAEDPFFAWNDDETGEGEA